MSIQVKEWYNEFSTKQVKTSKNLRHYTLINKIIDEGLNKHSKVLEIGCGIGTLTELLYKFIKKGQIVATDISDISISIAKKNIGISNRIEYIVSDMVDFNYPQKFDFIILPDVLEHIPIENHNDLFGTIAKHMHSSSKIIINIPHPKAIEFLKKVSPDKLQIIDQAINAKELIENTSYTDLLLLKYNSYSIYDINFDYAFIVLTLNQEFELNNKSKYEIIFNKQFNKIKYYYLMLTS